MKLAKLSLAAIVVASLSASAFAADSLAGAIKNGKVSGLLQAYDFNTKSAGTSANIINLGVDLSYVTDSLYGISAGVTMQSTNSPWANAAARTKFGGTMYGPGAVLSEAYLKYAINGFSIKAGRQYVGTPLVAGSGSRTTRQAFKGVIAGYTGVANTVIGAGYVTKYQKRTNGAGHIAQFGKYKDGAWTVYAKNHSVKGLKLLAAYAHAKGVTSVDDTNYFYTQADYSVKMSGANVGLGAQYYNSSTGKTTNATSGDGSLFGVRVTAGLNGLSGYIGYNKNDNKSNTLVGIGSGTGDDYAHTFFYTEEAYRAGVKAWGIGLAYDLSKVGAKGFKVKGLYNTYSGANNIKYNLKSYGLGAYYSFAGTYKGLKTGLAYESINYGDTTTKDVNKMRFTIDYKF